MLCLALDDSTTVSRQLFLQGFFVGFFGGVFATLGFVDQCFVACAEVGAQLCPATMYSCNSVSAAIRIVLSMPDRFILQLAGKVRADSRFLQKKLLHVGVLDLFAEFAKTSFGVTIDFGKALQDFH